MSFKAGVSRVVLLVGRFAIKVPNPRWGMKYFVMGMLGNMLERERWVLSKHPALVPVLACAPLGLLAIQRRCSEIAPRLLTKDEITNLPFIGYDNNGHNAGLLDGRLVLFDYGNADMYLIAGEEQQHG